MIELPPSLASTYEAVITQEVFSWSYGAVQRVRSVGANDWQGRRGTLDDESTFGPRLDDRCACGKYVGRQHRGIICDACGVKVAVAQPARRTRFGHINLQGPIPHPFGDEPLALEALPVLPVSFRASAAGSGVDDLYERVLLASEAGDLRAVPARFEELAAKLMPILTQAHAWNLLEADQFARALCLERRDVMTGERERCTSCGYPLAGLKGEACPWCGDTLADG